MRPEERIAQMLEEARERVRREEAERRRDPPPPPPAHWSETDREAEPTRLELEAGDLVARGTACARLRALLADGRWHSALELVAAGGLRYGGRLHEIRRGGDGEPALDVEAEARPHRGRTVWCYRAMPARSAS